MSTRVAVVLALVVLVVGLAAIVVAVVLVARRQSREQGRRLTRAEATAAGWEWRGDGADALAAVGVRDLQVPDVEDVMTRELDGHAIAAARTAGKRWTTTRGRWTVNTSVSATYSLCAVRLPGPLPSINLLAEGGGGRVATAAGLPDVDTESADFNERRRVVADDDRLAFDVLAPNVIAVVSDGPPDATVQVVGDQLVSFRRGEPDLAELASRAAWLVRVADAIPRFVFDARTD